jgi:hypothetical protein
MISLELFDDVGSLDTPDQTTILHDEKTRVLDCMAMRKNIGDSKASLVDGLHLWFRHFNHKAVAMM